MNWLCRLGLHHWETFGGETLRDNRGKIHLQWQVCARPHCQAMRARNKRV